MKSCIAIRGQVGVAIFLTAAAWLTITAFSTVAAQEGAISSSSVKRVEQFTPLQVPRIRALTQSEMTGDQRELLAAGNGRIDVRACLYHLPLCRAYWGITNQLLTPPISLPIRDHELLILRTAWLSRGHTIWSNHINGAAPKAGLADKDSQSRIVEGPDAPAWSDWERTLLRAADELHTARFLKDATWKALDQRYTEAQLFEALMTVGHNTTMTMYFNSVGIQPDAPAHPLPPDPEGISTGSTVTRSDSHRGVEARIKPLVRSQLSDAQLAVLDWATEGQDRYQTSVARATEPLPAENDQTTYEGSIQVRFCLYHLELCRAYWGITNQLRTEFQTIPVRDHELLVQRTAWLTHGYSIWSNHINAVSPRAGLADADSRARITDGPEAPGWTAWERTLLRAADELHMGRFIKDATWKALDEQYTEAQLLEVVMLVGNYTNVIMFFESVGNPPHGPIGLGNSGARHKNYVVHPMPPDL